MPKPRTKAILFRITPDEHARLLAECESTGARSLSDLARSRVLEAATAPSLVSMGRQLDELELLVHQLAQTLEARERNYAHSEAPQQDAHLPSH